MRAGQKLQLARHLRREMTLAERRLWQVLRHRQMGGYRFRRQHPIGPYITDFACLALCLVIEVDGGQHLDAASDQSRTRYLACKGWRVLRFWNHEVLTDLDGVYAAIVQNLVLPKSD